MHAAFELFAARGFDNVTMDEVARAADVSRRTAFRYFPTKEALVFPMREERLAHFRELLTQSTEGEPALVRVRRTCLTLAKEFAAAKEMFLAQEALVASSRGLAGQERLLEREWEDAIAETLSSETAPRRARILAAAIMGIVRGALHEWALGGATEDLVQIGREAFAILEEPLNAT